MARKPLLRVLNHSYPEASATMDDLYRQHLLDSIKVETREQAEAALQFPNRYRGVFLETLRVRTGNTRPSQDPSYFGNGIDIVNLAKREGLPVIVMSEADPVHEPEVLEKIQDADAVFEMPTDPEVVQQAMDEYFGSGFQRTPPEVIRARALRHMKEYEKLQPGVMHRPMNNDRIGPARRRDMVD